jgi:hypothetical protein
MLVIDYYQSWQYKNEQRVITPKLGKALNELYLPTKFEVDISCTFWVMSRQEICNRLHNQPNDQPPADWSIPP